MTDALDIWEKPQARNIYMIAGWRQWADAGSISSGLPKHLIKQTGAKKIGTIRPDGFYLFQIPGTHDLVRPVVNFEEGYPQSVETRRNELYYVGDDRNGIVIFLGDEPHLDVERYAAAFLEAARTLGVKRIIGFGGVYGELPYDKERMVSSIYSMLPLKDELSKLAVSLSDYRGGASIGSFICRRAAEQKQEFVAFYAFVPTYNFSNIAAIGNAIRIENDFMAWLGVMRRVKHMLNYDFDLSDLERKSEHLIEILDTKVEELERETPQVGIRDYLEQISERFTELVFNPLDEVWEDEIRRLFNDPDAPE